MHLGFTEVILAFQESVVGFQGPDCGVSLRSL